MYATHKLHLRRKETKKFNQQNLKNLRFNCKNKTRHPRFSKWTKTHTQLNFKSAAYII